MKLSQILLLAAAFSVCPAWTHAQEKKPKRRSRAILRIKGSADPCRQLLRMPRRKEACAAICGSIRWPRCWKAANRERRLFPGIRKEPADQGDQPRWQAQDASQGQAARRRDRRLDAMDQDGPPWPDSGKQPPSRKGEFQISDKDRAHWAYQPVKRPRAADRQESSLGARIRSMHLFSPSSKRRGLLPRRRIKQELVRRVYYDLTGLPPTPKEVDGVRQRSAPDAYEKLVDKLLASPQYGEKWARHWLDLVRYAETNSYERDNPKPQHLAVSRLRHPGVQRGQAVRSVPQGTACRRRDRSWRGRRVDRHRLLPPGRLGRRAGGCKQARYDGLDDIIATSAKSMLGMTLNCARCHNHKIDPIAQKDYYKMVAFLHGINHYRGGGADDLRPSAMPRRWSVQKIQQEHEEKRAETQGRHDRDRERVPQAIQVGHAGRSATISTS